MLLGRALPPQQDEALECLQRAADIFQQALGADHPSALEVSYELGCLHFARGDLPTALAYGQQALAARTLEPLRPRVQQLLLDIANHQPQRK